jgi:hypothetical protein
MPKKPGQSQDQPRVQRVQTGVRLEKRLLKTLKALAEYYDLSLGELLELLVLENFSGHMPFCPEALERISALTQIFGVTVDPQPHSPFGMRSATGPDLDPSAAGSAGGVEARRGAAPLR